MKFPRQIKVVNEKGCIAFLTQPRDGTEPRWVTDKHAVMYYQGETWRAHRLSYHLNVEPIPCLCGSRTEGFVLHTCDNGWCINDEHLYLGTAGQNIKDAWDRHPEFRDKQMKQRLGRYFSPETRRKISEALKGNQNSLGHVHSQATKSKISISKRRK